MLYAGIGLRAVAVIIDSILLFAVAYVTDLITPVLRIIHYAIHTHAIQQTGLTASCRSQ